MNRKPISAEHVEAADASDEAEGDDEDQDEDSEEMTSHDDKTDDDADKIKSLNERLHAEHSKLAQEAIRSSSDEYDKNLLKLSTVFLGLSLTFMKDIVHVDQLTHVYSLYSSWMLFAGTIFFTTVSFQSSVKANLNHLSVLDLYYLHGQKDVLNKKNYWNALTNWSNLAAGACFIAGIATTVYFVIRNFGGR